MDGNQAKKIQGIFMRLAESLPEFGTSRLAGDGSSGSSQTLRESFMSRGDFALYGDAANEYFEALEQIHSCLNKDQIWSRASLDHLLVEHLAKITLLPKGGRSAKILHHQKQFIETVRCAPEEWSVDLSVGGVDSDCGGVKFGAIDLMFDKVSSQFPIEGLVDTEIPLGAVFARIRVRAIDEQSARHFAEIRLDQHLAVLNALCSQRQPSLVRVFRGHSENLHRHSISRVCRVSSEAPTTTFHSCGTGISLRGHELRDCSKHVEETA
jgi:hypothetical protein